MKNLIAIFTIFISGLVVAQKEKAIMLNNGSVIIGKVLVNNDSIIKIKTKSDCIWKYSKSEVQSISDLDYVHHKRKFYTKLMLSAMPGYHFYSSFNVFNGYKINQHWKIGLGIGIDRVNNYRYIPLSIETEYKLFDQNTSPFIAINTIYELPFDSYRTKGGFSGSAHIGLNHFFSKRVGFSTSVGYRYAYLIEKNHNYFWEDYLTLREINRLEIKFGLVFN